ncbi:MAG: tetratricopeptide repeat protein [Candidatus Eisenbacteria bacterium]|nr:tetratricopeptide repeat protein [Candidatus Eisenbacteria bacterium]
MGTVAAIVVVIGIIAVIGYVGTRRRRSRSVEEEESAYHLGLNALIAGDRAAATRHLTRAVREDPSNADAYAKLGDLLRERGQVKQAIQIHRELLVRRRLSAPQRMEVTKSLARDFSSARRWKEVLETLGTLPRSERSDAHVLSMIRDAHEAMGDLDKAAQTHKEVLKADTSGVQPRPGVYRAHLGLAALRRGDRKKAKAEFQGAVKERPIPYLAYVYLGDIAVEEDDTERAVAYWMKLVIEKPECAHMVFERLERAYYDMGDFGRMMGIYEELVAKSPSSLPALLGLSKMLERKGDVEGALRTATEAVKYEGDALEGHRQIMDILLRNKRYEEAAEAARSLMERIQTHRGLQTCPSCGAVLPERGWRCDNCRAWFDEC